MAYKDYIKELKEKWVGQDYEYQGIIYKVVDVDYNGVILINKKSQFNDSTAVAEAY